MLERVYRLRVEAWRARMSEFPPIGIWTDAFDAVGRHWVILDAGEPVAAARLTVHDRLAEAPNAEVYRDVLPHDLAGPIGVLTRLVVRKSHGSRGLSALLDRSRIEAADACGCRYLIGETFAGMPRFDQMRSLGFEAAGPASPYSDGPLRAVKGMGGDRLAMIVTRSRGDEPLRRR